MIFRNENTLDQNKYILVDYFIKSKTSLRDAAWGLAIGQSVGNPNVRSVWETDELFENHSCMIIGDENELSSCSSGEVTIAFPVENLDLKTDGVSQLLCHVMGGQLDIDIIEKCQVKDIRFPESAKKHFRLPKYGIEGIREYTGCHERPMLGGIIKPKTGVTAQVLLEMVKEMVEGGVNFIKEDEILSSPSFCSIEERVPLIMDYLKDKNVIYAVCINSDSPYLLDRVKKVHEMGGNAVHVNFWSGLGCYKAIRELDLPMFLFFQKSGDKILTNESHAFHIKWDVICKLAGMMGVDFIHAGMWGGYMKYSDEDLRKTIDVLHENNVMPSLSCGMNPGLVQAISKRYGFDYMANVGGALHGHPGGTKAGVIAMRQSIDGDHGQEYEDAISKWGLKD